MRTFEFRDDKSAKFWSIDLDDNSFTVRFGKIGTAGQTQTKEFADAAAAQKEHDKLIAEKVKKGYIEVQTAASPPISTPQAAAVPKSAVKKAPKAAAGTKGNVVDSPPLSEAESPKTDRRTFELRKDRFTAFLSVELQGTSLTECREMIGAFGQTLDARRGTSTRNFSNAKAALKEQGKCIAEAMANGFHEIDSSSHIAKSANTNPTTVVSSAPVGELETACLTSRSTRDGEALAKHYVASGRWATYAGDVVFVEEPLPNSLGEIRKLYQQHFHLAIPLVIPVPLDLLFFRVLPADALHHVPLSDAMYSDALPNEVLIRSPHFEWHGDIASEMRLGQYGFSEAVIGSPMSFLAIDPESFTGEGEGTLTFSEFKQQIDELIVKADVELRTYGFVEGDPFFAHWVDDRSHSHGFIPIPWRLHVGQTHAVAAIWRGTWY